MSYQTIDSVEVVQVFSPTLVSDALLVTIRSFPSGSVLIRTIPSDVFNADGSSPLLASLSDEVENILHEGTATAAQGTQGIDDSGLIFDAVDFTVAYVPPDPIPGSITTVVEIPVNIITADTGLLGGSGAASAADLINAAYQRLKAMYSG